MDDNVRPYIELADGSKWYCEGENPRLAPEVLAQSLGNLCRFTGHCAYFYSVAEHLVKCSHMLEKMGRSDLAFEALMHDAHEALVNDLSKPVKAYIGGSYEALEQWAESEIRRQFGLPPSIHPLVKKADRMMCVIEADAVMPSRGKSWGGQWEEVRADAMRFDAWYFRPAGWQPTLFRGHLGESATRWLDRYKELVVR